MSGGIFEACSGMRAQMDALDILANNLANLNTAGFKQQKSFFTILGEALEPSQIEDRRAFSGERYVQAQSSLILTEGQLATTKRDLDVALQGEGFLVVDTPGGTRYTRDGSLRVNGRSELSTADGLPILGLKGRIAVGPGKVNITEQGDVYVDMTRVDRLKVVTFDNASSLVREGSSLLAPADGQVKEVPSKAIVRQGHLEQSNVSPVGSMVEMVGIMRRFEAIQKCVNLMINDLDAKSIEKLGR